MVMQTLLWIGPLSIMFKKQRLSCFVQIFLPF